MWIELLRRYATVPLSIRLVYKDIFNSYCTREDKASPHVILQGYQRQRTVKLT